MIILVPDGLDMAGGISCKNEYITHVDDFNMPHILCKYFQCVFHRDVS